MQFNMAADLIDYDDYQHTAEWQMAQERQKELLFECPSPGCATVLMKTAEVQEHAEDNEEQLDQGALF